MGIEQLKNARFDGNKLYFDAELFKENSFRRWSIGQYKNLMELVITGKARYQFGTIGYIEWLFGKDAPDEEEEVIGVWFDEDKNLTDYDGVFELPEEAIVLLEHLGYNCDYAKDEEDNNKSQ